MLIFKEISKFFHNQPKIYFLEKYIDKRNVDILDVGAGNNSPSFVKKYYPESKYYAIDKCFDERHYSFYDKICIERYFEIDLESNDLECINDYSFDYIIIAHVIEHIRNGEEIIKKLTNNLKRNGYIYIEFPSIRSLYLPSMRDTLNFFDDISHVRIYQIFELLNLLMSNDLEIIKYGKRRFYRRIIFIPFYMLSSIIKKKYISASVFWDILGFADFILAKKK